MPSRVEFRHLRAFVAVADLASYRKAAERLRIAQPALSRTVQQLERHVGSRLLERTTRFVRLTEAGHSYLKHARAMLVELDGAEATVRRIALGQRGEVSVGFNDFTISEILPPIIHRFRSTYPDVIVNLLDHSSRDMIELVAAGQLDIAFSSGVVPPSDQQTYVLRDEQLVCVLPAHHPYASRQRLRLRELAEEPFVLGTPAWNVFLETIGTLCAAAGFTPRVVQTAVHSDGIINLVAAGVGVTLYVDRAWLHRRDDVVVRPISGAGWRFRSVASWPRRPRSACVENLVGVMRELIK